LCLQIVNKTGFIYTYYMLFSNVPIDCIIVEEELRLLCNLAGSQTRLFVAILLRPIDAPSYEKSSEAAVWTEFVALSKSAEGSQLSIGDALKSIDQYKPIRKFDFSILPCPLHHFEHMCQ
jgi:hypothetical protein